MGIVLAVAVVVIALDQTTKAMVTAWLGPASNNHRFEVIESALAFRYARNRGAAFGFFDDQGILLALFAAVVIGGLLVVTYQQPVQSRWQRLSIGLIAGGAAGNLIDRLRHGYVTDFIDVGPWPTFNVADTAITIGIGMVVIHGFAPAQKAEPMRNQEGVR